jgi:hypothetical protein
VDGARTGGRCGRPAGGQDRPGQGADLEPFPVATAAEIEIVRIDGADTGTIVVGTLPVTGPLVLAVAGEVTVTRVAPADDKMVPDMYLEGPDAPVIWAPRGDNEAADQP